MIAVRSLLGLPENNSSTQKKVLQTHQHVAKHAEKQKVRETLVVTDRHTHLHVENAVNEAPFLLNHAKIEQFFAEIALSVLKKIREGLA